MSDNSSLRGSYEDLCSEIDYVPLWQQPWWLDASAGDGMWGATIVREKGQVAAALPYRYRRYRGLRVLDQPPLTQFLGPLLKVTSAKTERRVSQQMNLLPQLAEALPRFDLYLQNWGPGSTNWLPFYHAGFKATPRLTYRLELGKGLDAIWQGFASSNRRAIRKAEGRMGLHVQEGADIERFMRMNQQVFVRQAMDRPFSTDAVRRIDHAAAARGARRMTYAADNEGRAHAAGYFVQDDRSVYYLMGGTDLEVRNSGGMNLLLWEAIKHAHAAGKPWFDFEGSMNRNIEAFFRSFGGSQTPITGVMKGSNRMLTAALMLM